MTCGAKEIGLLVKLNRRLLVLAKDHCAPFSQLQRSFSTTTGDNDNSNNNESHTKSDTKKNPIKDIPDGEIKKSVFISQSHDIYTNLALEDWLYRNFDFTTHHVLMLWTNDPCVVVGRHQNP